MAENDKKEYRNWYKTLLRIQKKELILFGVLILLAFIFVGISKKAYEWFKIIKIYSVLDKNPLINIPICIIISGFAIWWWTKIWKDKDIRPYRLGIIVFGLIVFIFIDGFLYANIVCNFSYQWFFIGLFSLLFIVSLIKIFATCEITWAQNLIDWTFEIFKKLIKRIKIFWENKGKIKDKENNNTTESNGGSVDNIEIKDSKENKEPELKGFSVDDTKIKLEDNQIKYAETLVKKLKNTDLSKESFAVGITGEWGSGKSTFLNTMKKEIKKAKFAEIVEFNPWLCNSPEQVTQDFFATLINELSPKHSTLSRDINKYAKLLNKIAKASLSFFGIDLDLTPSDDSLNKLKDKISNKLAKLQKKVVILIDDTDRLEGNEVFEILRLIRNTADFKNVIYIATYDKEYVTEVLKGNKIKDPSAYLEKIFQTEVHLPKTRDYLLWKILSTELDEFFYLDGIDSISVEEQNLVLKVLINYRQIKRFARHYITYRDYINNSELAQDINKICLFWVELLQMYDKKAYDILAKDYTCLLNDSDDQIVQLKNPTYTLKLKLKLKDETLNILDRIFQKKDYTDIQYKANYDKYFSLSISPFEVSMIEYNTAISYSGENKINNAKATINRWVNIEKKHDDSIITRFITSLQYLNAIDHSENYISLILYFALIRKGNFNKIKSLLEKKEIGQYSSERISEIIEKWFNSEIDNYESNEKLIRLSEFLNQMYHYYTINGEGYILNNPKYFIDNEKIEELLLSIMTKLIDNNNINDIDFSKIYRNCIAVNKELKYIPGERINIEYKQLPKFRSIFNNFSNQNKTPLFEDGRYPTFEEFKEAYEDM
ncbi:MAG: P-loop NTPase fold protein [Bacteroidales bacterium]|nr:P-loop NTPase fold protein [Bacteroidales bacterium]